MSQKIESTALTKYGISTNHEIMDNGEIRFRLLSTDGSSYIRCENPENPVWENGHSHTTLQEIVIVQTGCVLFVEYLNRKAIFQKLQAGDYATTTPGIPHTECLAGGTSVHTIKFGDCSCNDWIPCPELDALTQHLSFEEALEKATK